MSSPEASDYFPEDDIAAPAPSTPTASSVLANPPPSELSPPSSTGPSGGRVSAFNPPPTSTDPVSMATANGGVSLQTPTQDSPTMTLSGGGGGGGGATVGMRGGRTTANSALDAPTAATGQPLGVHPGGYAWYRPEDEPGFAWKNKKAQEEWGRAWDQVLDKDIMVLNKYGDPCDERVLQAQK
ncbi:hypothetical protein H2199_001617 [Coniosporium tulheliwenetii]|nr:hypothetical protein H2199_001617 [Cladosporium sp. JES 115]